MSQPLVVSIPHRLGRQEAKRRLESGIAGIPAEFGPLVMGLNYSWQADSLYFSAQVMWQRVSGRIEVLDDVVRIEIDLPWLMRLIEPMIAKQARERTILMLEKPVA